MHKQNSGSEQQVLPERTSFVLGECEFFECFPSVFSSIFRVLSSSAAALRSPTLAGFVVGSVFEAAARKLVAFFVAIAICR